MHIRLATAADIAAIANLENEHYAAEGYPAAFLFQAYRQWPNLLWVAERTKENGSNKPATNVCAYLLAAPGQQQGHVWIMSVLVAAQARGMRLGSALMQQAITELRQQGAQQLWLSVAPENVAAIELYGKLGFQKQSYQADYLGNGEHRDILCLHVSA